MKHLDEGTLQAWLDRPRSGLGTGEALEIERHLETCDRCAAALEDLGGSDLRAAGILSRAEAREVEVPDFASVFEVGAGARSEQSGRSKENRLRSLAWAATIVLALGIGWVTNEVYRGASEAGSGSSAASTDVALAPEATEVAPPEELESAAASELPERAEARLDPVARSQSVGDAAAADSDAVGREAFSDQVEALELAPEAAGDPTADGARPADAPLRQLALAEAEAIDVDTLEMARQRAAGMEPDVGFEPLTVPGLAVASIEMDDAGAVRVTQVLGPDAVLVLIERTEGLMGDLLDSADDQSIVTVTLDGIDVTGTAPISADSLRVLLGLLQE